MSLGLRISLKFVISELVDGENRDHIKVSVMYILGILKIRRRLLTGIVRGIFTQISKPKQIVVHTYCLLDFS